MSTTRDNPASEALIDTWHNHYQKGKNRDSISLYNTTKDFLETQEGLDHETLPATPPWLYQKPNIDLSLLETVNKKDNSPELNRQLAEANLEQYCECLQVFTDGSKTGDEATGVAFHVPAVDHNHAIRLPGFRAELIDIMFALCWLIDNCKSVCTPVVIFFRLRSRHPGHRKQEL